MVEENNVRDKKGESLDDKISNYKRRRIQNLVSLLRSYENALVLDDTLEKLMDSKREQIESSRAGQLDYIALSDVLNGKREEKFNKGVDDPKHYFHFKETSSGPRECKDYKELAGVLVDLSDEEFKDYVNKYKNDIAHWLENSVKDPDTARLVSLTKSREETIDLLVGVPLAFALYDKQYQRMQFVNHEFGIPVIEVEKSIESQKQGKLDHYSIAIVSKKEHDRVFTYRGSEGKGLSMRKILLKVNEVLYSNPSNTVFLKEMFSLFDQLAKQNPEDEKLGETLEVVQALISLEKERHGLDNLIKHGKFRYEILEVKTPKNIMKLSDKIGPELRNEIEAVEHYKKIGLNVPVFLGCYNFGNRTISILRKVPGDRIDKVLDDLSKENLPQSRQRKRRILESYVRNTVKVHTEPPPKELVTTTHSTQEKNYDSYIREITAKFVGFSPLPNIAGGLASLINDSDYIKRTREEFLGEEYSPNVSKSVYSGVAKIIGDAEAGFYKDMSLYNCFIEGDSNISLIDFESLRNSPYTFDLATGFEMRKLVSNAPDIELKENLHLNKKVVYKKGDRISEKEHLLCLYAKEFNKTCKAEKREEFIVRNYNEFIKEYYAAAVHRSLIHFGTFSRLIKTQEETREQEHKGYAIECLENAIESTGILKERFSKGSEFDTLYARLNEIRGRLL